MVNKRQIGQTELEVSELSWGTVKVGRNYKVNNKSQDGFDLPSDAIVQKIIELSLEHGINFIDTAPAYGIAEERLGKLLSSHRKEFVISTKAGEEFDGKESTYNFSSEHLIKSVERSLKRLKTDYLDSVLLHLPRNDLETMQQNDVFETLELLKTQGKLRTYGASTHTIEGGTYALENSDLVMIPFNPDYQEHLPVIKKAAELNKGVTIKKGFYSGFLNEKNKTEAIANCFSEALQYPAVSSLVVGTINPHNFLENLKILEDQ